MSHPFPKDLLSLIDRLIALLREGERLDERYFVNIVKPLYEDAERIYADYLKTLDQLSKMLENGASDDALISFLETRMTEYHAVRVRMRATAVRIMNKPSRSALAPRSRFAKGVWALMRGGLAISEPGQCESWNGRFSGHTLLDMLRLIKNDDADPRRYSAPERAEFLDKQRRFLSRAWREVVEAYADMQTMIYKR